MCFHKLYQSVDSFRLKAERILLEDSAAYRLENFLWFRPSEFGDFGRRTANHHGWSHQLLYQAFEMAGGYQSTKIAPLVARDEDIGTQIDIRERRIDGGPGLRPFNLRPFLDLGWQWR